MLAFLTIFAAGLCGYASVPAVAWPAAAIGLASVSWGQRYRLIQRGLESGLEDAVLETLVRSFFNALAATGGCYWFGVAVRMAFAN